MYQRREIVEGSAEWLLIIAGVALVALCAAPTIDGDGIDRLKAVRSFFEAGPLYRTKFSLVQPMLGSLLYGLGGLFNNAERWLAAYNTVVFLSLLAALCSWLHRVASATFARRATLMLMCATTLPYAITGFYGELTTVLFITLGYTLFGVYPWRGAVLMSLGAANSPATIPALAVLLLFEAIRQRKKALLAWLALPLAMILADNMLKTGTPFHSAYMEAAEHGMQTILPYSGRAGFSYPMMFGLLSIVFAVGRGLIFFVPGIFLPLVADWPAQPPAVRRANIALLLFTFVLALTYSKWWAWYGGNTWGPRFFHIAAVPSTLYMTSMICRDDSEYRLRDLWIVPALLLSGWVSIEGFVWGTAGLSSCEENNYSLEFLCWYVPEFSPLWRQFVVGFLPGHRLRTFYGLWQAVALAYLCYWPSVVVYRRLRTALVPRLRNHEHPSAGT